jgi:glycosyltransferase involved in cell wall biosynthesis
MKVAIVHDFLVQMGGAEKVVEVLHDLFPDAPIYTSVYDAQAMPDYYRTWDIRTSFMQRVLMKRHTHRLALLLYPTAFESFDFSKYDLVISSSSAFAKGIITQPHTTHVCYTYTPMRYVWMTANYVRNEGIARPLRRILTPGLHYLRTWDSIAATRVDKYVAISRAVARRINKFYRRDSEIIYPPVDTCRFKMAKNVGDYYMIASRFAPYKRLDLAVKAFTELGRPLKVVGTGRQMKALQDQAGDNVEFLGHVDNDQLAQLMARSKAYIMPGEEDFGIAPVEANACGRPVIAYAAGGALDTQEDEVTGVLFKEQSVAGLCEAVLYADTIDFNPEEIQAHARQFDVSVFRQRIKEVTIEPLINGSPLYNRRRSDRRQGDRRRQDAATATAVESRESNGSATNGSTAENRPTSTLGPSWPLEVTSNGHYQNGHNGHTRHND